MIRRTKTRLTSDELHGRADQPLEADPLQTHFEQDDSPAQGDADRNGERRPNLKGLKIIGATSNNENKNNPDNR